MIRKIPLVFITVAGSMVLLSGGCGSAIDKAANKNLLDGLGHTSVSVFPTLVRTTEKKHDESSAGQLAAYLNDAKLAQAVISEEQIDVPGAWSVNQSKMYRASAAAVASHVKRHPLKTELRDDGGIPDRQRQRGRADSLLHRGCRGQTGGRCRVELASEGVRGREAQDGRGLHTCSDCFAARGTEAS